MPNLQIDKFKGLYTNSDEYSADGAIVANNVDINLQGDLVKSKGYSLIAGSGVSATACIGATEFNGSIYAMLVVGGVGKLYRSPETSRDWTLVDTTLTFNAANNVEFAKYSDQRTNGQYLLFVNGEKKTIGAYDGGVFCYDGTAPGAGTISLFGKTNNPTGGHIEVHNERVFVGDITAIGSTAEGAARHWIVVSKLFPELEDSSFAISAMTVGVRTLITCTGHTFNVGDIVYITGANNTAGTNKLNGSYHEITETASNTFYVDTDTTGLTAGTTGTATLRGNTWSPATAEYEGSLQGAGIFRCDNSADDYIMSLKSGFGVLAIFRKNTIYFFTGAVESGTATLARKMNLPYGAISSSTLLTEGGIWFVSQYGLSKVEGVTIQTTKTELDNITSITYTEKIKPTYEAIVSKATLQLFQQDRKLWLYDNGSHRTIVLDLLNGEFTAHTSRYYERFVFINDAVYGIYKDFIYKTETGYQTYNESTASSIISTYRLPVFSFNDGFNVQHIKELFMLIEGTSSTTPVSMTVNLYYDGGGLGKSISFDITQAAGGTWNEITSNASVTWNTLTTSGTVTWTSLTGEDTSILQRRAYDIGYCKNIQMELNHNTGADGFKVGMVVMNYDTIVK